MHLRLDARCIANSVYFGCKVFDAQTQVPELRVWFDKIRYAYNEQGASSETTTVRLSDEHIRRTHQTCCYRYFVGLYFIISRNGQYNEREYMYSSF